LAQLAERSAVAPERVLALVDAQCVPPHSYEVRGVAIFASTFGEYPASLPARRYYHPSLVAWVKRAEALARRHPLAEVARRVREDFEAVFEEALAGCEPPWPGGVDHAWSYLMDGTWGLCLEAISAEALLQKEFARQTIARLVSTEPDHALSETARTALVEAVEAYDGVTAAFAPHERAESSRRREIEAAIEKYGLAPALGAGSEPLPSAS